MSGDGFKAFAVVVGGLFMFYLATLFISLQFLTNSQSIRVSAIAIVLGYVVVMTDFNGVSLETLRSFSFGLFYTAFILLLPISGAFAFFVFYRTILRMPIPNNLWQNLVIALIAAIVCYVASAILSNGEMEGEAS